MKFLDQFPGFIEFRTSRNDDEATVAAETPASAATTPEEALALQGNRARKGVFITTSSFSRDAQEFVERIDSKIVLIDGATLTRFMVDSGVGVSLVTSYEVKRVDSDYFSEE